MKPPKQTLQREVREEVGVEIANLRYFQSQSWPFPNQLMLGFFAEYAGGEIVCDRTEIADARWFHYSDLPMIPPLSSISGQLIHHYIAILAVSIWSKPLEFIYEYGLFLAQAVTIVAAILILVAGLVSLGHAAARRPARRPYRDTGSQREVSPHRRSHSRCRR